MNAPKDKDIQESFKKIIDQASKLQDTMKDAQQKLKEITVVGEALAGAVKIHMQGDHKVPKVEFDDSFLDEDIETMEEAVQAAINGAVDQIEAAAKKAMMAMSANFGLSGFQLPDDDK